MLFGKHFDVFSDTDLLPSKPSAFSLECSVPKGGILFISTPNSFVPEHRRRMFHASKADSFRDMGRGFEKSPLFFVFPA